MKTTTPTSLRKDLFQVMKSATRFVPTRIRYKKGDAILLSYQQYLTLTQKKKSKFKKKEKGLQPLLSGKILKPLNEKAEKALMRYMGL